jgi:hypothetical protein
MRWGAGNGRRRNDTWRLCGPASAPANISDSRILQKNLPELTCTPGVVEHPPMLRAPFRRCFRSASRSRLARHEPRTSSLQVPFAFGSTDLRMMGMHKLDCVAMASGYATKFGVIGELRRTHEPIVLARGRWNWRRSAASVRHVCLASCSGQETCPRRPPHIAATVAALSTNRRAHRFPDHCRGRPIAECRCRVLGAGFRRRNVLAAGASRFAAERESKKDLPVCGSDN